MVKKMDRLKTLVFDDVDVDVWYDTELDRTWVSVSNMSKCRENKKFNFRSKSMIFKGKLEVEQWEE